VKKFKILWLSPTELSHQQNSSDRGWINILSDEIKGEVDLHVAVVEGNKNASINGITRHNIRVNNRTIRIALHALYGYRNTEGDLKQELLALVKSVNPDLVHIHGTEKQFIKIIPYLNKENIPYLISIQGIISIISRKYTAGYSELFVKRFVTQWGFTKNQILPRTNRRIHNVFLRHAKLEDKMLQLATNFSGRTKWDETIALLMNPAAAYFKNDRILKPIYYESSWSNMRRIENQIRIHSTTSNSFYKGFEIIAESAFLMKRSGLKIEWCIAGLSSNDWSVKAAKKKLKERFDPTCFTFLGKVTSKEIVESMQAADLYVSASHIENSPNNVAEAQLLGIPCIATDVGGTSSYIENNISGVLIPPGDPFALAATIKNLGQDEKKRALLALTSRKRALERHDKKRIASTLLGDYETIINTSIR
jgi:glycosyltransferase involved in cell wall biosynthesis